MLKTPITELFGIERPIVQGGLMWIAKAELAAGVRAAADALRGLGIRREERVMMMMADRPSFLEVFWGAITHGAVPVPVSTPSASPSPSESALSGSRYQVPNQL